MEEKQECFGILNLKEKDFLERRRPTWEDNIRMDLKQTGAILRIWIDSAQDSDYWRVLVNLALTSGQTVSISNGGEVHLIPLYLRISALYGKFVVIFVITHQDLNLRVGKIYFL